MDRANQSLLFSAWAFLSLWVILVGDLWPGYYLKPIGWVSLLVAAVHSFRYHIIPYLRVSKYGSDGTKENPNVS